MTSSPIRILAIVPYALLRQQILEIGADYENLEITIEVGNLEQAVTIFNSYSSQQFDAILSRGGTQIMLTNVTDLPVIDIPIDSLDLINILSLIRSYEGKPAIVAYHNIINMAKKICAAMSLSFDFFPIRSREDAKRVIARLKKEGYTLIVGDTVGQEYAQAAHLSTILITSGKPSIANALQNAIQMVTQIRQASASATWARPFVGWSNREYFIFSRRKELLFTSNSTPENGMCKLLQRLIPSVSVKGQSAFLRSLHDITYLIYSKSEGSRDSLRYLFCTQPMSFHQQHKKKFRSTEWRTRDQVQQILTHQFLNTHENSIPDPLLQKNPALPSIPLLITGEDGSEKNNFVYNLFLQTASPETVLFTVSCACLTEIELKTLLGNPESPFWTEDAFFFFKDIELMSDSLVSWLVSELEAGEYKRYRRLIFTLESIADEKDSPEFKRYQYLLREFRERVGALYMPISPLRGNRQRISHLVTLFMDQIHRSTGGNIVGMTPEAMELLQQESWPQNSSQLFKVLLMAAQGAQESWITSSDIRQVLLQAPCFAAEKENMGLNLDQPLEDIKYDIIRKKLMAEKMTQEQVADQLGISRSTLWRILRRKKDSHRENAE